jgi:nitroreductase
MVRSFSGSPVDGGRLQAVLEAFERAPTAGNTRGVSCIVLEGADQTKIFWQATTTREWRTRARRWPGLSRAPVVLVLVASAEEYVRRYAEPDKAGSQLGSGSHAWPVPYWFVDAGMAAGHMLLAAVEQGLGACFLGNFRGEADLLTSLGVPAEQKFVGAVLVGEPGDEDPRSTSLDRAGAGGRVHRGAW